MIRPDTPLSALTVRDLRELIAETVRDQQRSDNVVRGLAGIADAFGISLSQAKRLKASGIIDGALSQSGRTIIVNKARALELFEAHTHGKPTAKR